MNINDQHHVYLPDSIHVVTFHVLEMKTNVENFPTDKNTVLQEPPVGQYPTDKNTVMQELQEL